ncbi:MAG: hypothetical protein JJU37_06940 [Balneolaceae bacterium]|nr:hypothetical protein [Balneolaceae bacterium]
MHTRILMLLIPVILYPSLLLGQLQRERVVQDTAVELTFMAPRNINLFTVEPLSKGELHYSIMHTFGEVNSGVRTLWGVDQGANVRFSFEYGFGDNISVGFGRSSMDKVYDVNTRITLLRQRTDGSVPVSVTAAPSVGINTSSFGFLNENYSFSDRLNFSLALPIARKFNSDFSLMIVPMAVHFNRTGPELNISDPEVNTYYSIGVGGRYKFASRTALSFQYIPPLTDAENLSNNIGIGIDIETGGHVFQMFFTTSRALNESYLIASDNGNFFDREFRFGFNINRLFRIR